MTVKFQDEVIWPPPEWPEYIDDLDKLPDQDDRDLYQKQPDGRFRLGKRTREFIAERAVEFKAAIEAHEKAIADKDAKVVELDAKSEKLDAAHRKRVAEKAIRKAAQRFGVKNKTFLDGVAAIMLEHLDIEVKDGDFACLRCGGDLEFAVGEFLAVEGECFTEREPVVGQYVTAIRKLN